MKPTRTNEERDRGRREGVIANLKRLLASQNEQLPAMALVSVYRPEVMFDVEASLRARRDR